MKQLFEWIKATPDNLPKINEGEKMSVAIMFCGVHFGAFVVKEGFLTANGRLLRADDPDLYFLSPASPLPISGDVEHGKDFSYTGQIKTLKEQLQARDGEVDKLVDLIERMKFRLMSEDLNEYGWRLINEAKEALKPYQSFQHPISNKPVDTSNKSINHL